MWQNVYDDDDEYILRYLNNNFHLELSKLCMRTAYR